MMTIDGYMGPFRPGAYSQRTISYDRFNALVQYYHGRGELLANMRAAMEIIVANPGQASEVANKALGLFKEMANKCHPPQPEWGHLYDEYLELPSKLVFNVPEKLDKNSLYEVLGIKET